MDGGEEVCGPGNYLLFVILNADFRLQFVHIPDPPEGKQWYRVIDTSLEADADFLDEGQEALVEPPGDYLANPRSTVLLVAT
jgi:hypothetical protein